MIAKEELVKDEILSQAQKLFKQFGLKKTTMDEIAAACGKAKSTLYHYFKNKEEVFDDVINLELKNLRIIVKEKVDSKKSLNEKMITYFINFHEEVLNKVNLYRVVTHELLNESLAESHFQKLMEFEKSYITRILEDGYDTGEIAGFQKKDIPWFSEILIAAFLGIVRYSIQNDSGLDQEKLKMTANILIPRLFT